MNDIVKEAFDRLEKAVRDQGARDTHLKDAELLAVPAVAAAAAAAYIASRSHREPAPAANDQLKPADPGSPTPWPAHPPQLSQPVQSPAHAVEDPLVLEVEQAAARSAPVFEPHAAVLGPMASQPAPPTEIASSHTVVTDPLILELESGHIPPVAAAPEPIAEPLVAHTAPPPPMEPRQQWVDHRVTPPPFWAEPSFAPPPEVAVTQPVLDQHEHGIDPILAGFDHVVCLTGYGLLFASVFTLGVPALAALALAYVHRRDSHLLVRSHFRFQLRIFWTAVLFLALAVTALLVGTGLGVGWLFALAQSNPALSGVATHASAWSGGAAGLLMIAAILLAVIAALWTLGASVLGFLRLLANQPIGHKQVE